VSSPQPPPVLDQKRLNDYIQQFKKPVSDQLANFSQFVPNTIDQLIQQCVFLEMELAKTKEENEKLVAEKTLSRTITQNVPEPQQIPEPPLTNGLPPKEPGP